MRATGVDALYAGGAKWLMALQGVSFLWLRAALLDRIALRLPGWRSVEDIWNFLDYEQPPAPNASRYEGGTPNIIGALSLATSMDVLANAGIDRIGAHVLALTDRCRRPAARAAGRSPATVRATREIGDRHLPPRRRRRGRARPPARRTRTHGQHDDIDRPEAPAIRVAPHGLTRVSTLPTSIDVSCLDALS